jgi:uncharacterized membrane protein
MAKQERLDIPGRRRSDWIPRMRMESDAFGSFAESFARWMGTAQFLMWMSVAIIAWVVWNVVLPGAPDPFPFLFLTLALSLQASYAAPLILLAANRQEARDRVSLEHDREVSAQSRADMDFLAREIASLRMRMNDVATRDFIRSELRELLEELDSREPEDTRKHLG